MDEKRIVFYLAYYCYICMTMSYSPKQNTANKWYNETVLVDSWLLRVKCQLTLLILVISNVYMSYNFSVVGFLNLQFYVERISFLTFERRNTSASQIKG